MILRRLEQPKRGDASNHPDFLFWCPGCKCGHGVWTTKKNDQNAIWKFNGDMEKPTFSPSLKIESERGTCHLIVEAGRLKFCSDSTHELAGKTVEMEPF